MPAFAAVLPTATVRRHGVWTLRPIAVAVSDRQARRGETVVVIHILTSDVKCHSEDAHIRGPAERSQDAGARPLRSEAGLP
ncbi:MAG: hypothetical protein QOC62_1560 [Mycobacterium sp.]|jgi:hypothetical protein|nr:hypothetical protein [Mycobacterium sp.]